MAIVPYEREAFAPLPQTDRPSAAHRWSGVGLWIGVILVVVGVILAGSVRSAATFAGLILLSGLVVVPCAALIFWLTRHRREHDTRRSMPRRSHRWSESVAPVTDADVVLMLFLIPLIVVLVCVAALFRSAAQKTLERFLTALKTGDIATAR